MAYVANCILSGWGVGWPLRLNIIKIKHYQDYIIIRITNKDIIREGYWWYNIFSKCIMLSLNLKPFMMLWNSVLCPQFANAMEGTPSTAIATEVLPSPQDSRATCLGLSTTDIVRASCPMFKPNRLCEKVFLHRCHLFHIRSSLVFLWECIYCICMFWPTTKDLWHYSIPSSWCIKCLPVLWCWWYPGLVHKQSLLTSKSILEHFAKCISLSSMHPSVNLW